LSRTNFVNVRIDVTAQGVFSLSFDGQQIYTNLALPGFTPLTGARFALGGRTGGKYETHDIDDLALSLLAAVPASVNYDFASNAPAGSTLLGSATVTNGYLSLTPPTNNQMGTLILPDLAPSNVVAGFTATFKVRMTSGSTPPADGFSFVWANNLTNAFGEEGAGYGLVVSFDTYDNGNGEAPAIDVKWRSLAAQGLVTVTVTGLNDPPVAVADFIAINEGSGTNNLTSQLLANDTDPDNGETATLSISVVSGVTTNGTLTLQSGAVLYAPYANANLRVDDVAVDSFTYTVSDVHGATSNAVATIYIVGTNNTFLASATTRMTPGSNGTPRLEFPGTPRAVLNLETSTNLVNWSFYASVIVPTNGLAEFIERNTTNPPVRFYRLRDGGAMPPGLVSFWRADGDASDSFGTNQAQLTNGLSFTTGHIGSAFNFTGGSERLAIGAASLPLPWTASFWVNRQDAFDPSDALLTDSTYALKLEQYQANRRVGITQYGINDPAYNYTVPTNTWTHLVFVATASGTSLYVNGSFVQSLPFSFPLPMQTISRPGTSDRLRAALDDIAIFNRALTPPEVLNLYNVTGGR
jgi:VCBS repeat-containing protein